MDFFGSPMQLSRIMERSSKYILNVCKYPIPMIALHIRFKKKGGGGILEWNTSDFFKNSVDTYFISFYCQSFERCLQDIWLAEVKVLTLGKINIWGKKSLKPKRIGSRFLKWENKLALKCKQNLK